MKVLLLPTLILAFPMTWLVLQLDTVYGHRPLRAGEAAVVTAQMGRAIGAGERIELRGTGGVQVETPGFALLVRSRWFGVFGRHARARCS